MARVMRRVQACWAAVFSVPTCRSWQVSGTAGFNVRAAGHVPACEARDARVVLVHICLPSFLISSIFPQLRGAT